MWFYTAMIWIATVIILLLHIRSLCSAVLLPYECIASEYVTSVKQISNERSNMAQPQAESDARAS